MANWIWQKKEDKDQGFSLVELLIVVIIMGVLAAIAIPLFISQRAKAEDAKVTADVEMVGKEVATWWTDSHAGVISAPEIFTNDGGTTYHIKAAGTSEGADENNLIGPVSSKVKDMKVYGTSSKTWCVSATNPEGKNKTYFVSATSALQPAPSAASAAAACGAAAPDPDPGP